MASVILSTDLRGKTSLVNGILAYPQTGSIVNCFPKQVGKLNVVLGCQEQFSLNLPFLESVLCAYIIT